MPWFKVDDALAYHAKVVAAGNPAMGLWVRAGSWCAQQLTDGFIPDHMLAALGTRQQAQRLVDNRLWERVEGGYRFHEWVERQPSKVDVEAERAAARDRMREHRAKRQKARQKASSQVSESRSPEPSRDFDRTSDEVRDVFGNPDPTRPDPVPVPTLKKKPAPDGADEFDQFWKVYPRRKDKGHALKAWRAAIKKVDPTVIIEAAFEFANLSTSKDPQYLPYPATWLNGERWADEERASHGPSRRTNVHDLESPPDGLSQDELNDWYDQQRARRRQA